MKANPKQWARLVGGLLLLVGIVLVGVRLYKVWWQPSHYSQLKPLLGPYPKKQGAIVLTLDDGYVRNWFDNRNWLDSLGLKTTIYLTEADPLSITDWQLVDSLRAAGVEIEAHGARHLNAPEYLEDHDTTTWRAVELDPHLKSLASHGIKPLSFAWPYGAEAPELIRVLGLHFGLIRGCCHPKRVKAGKFEDALYQYDGARSVNALCLDNDLFDSSRVKQALAQAAVEQSAVVLYGHELVNDGQVRTKTNKATLAWLARWQRYYALQSLQIRDLVDDTKMP